MLVLTRKKDESILIGDEIEIIVLEINPTQIRLGINAPKTLDIYRREVYEDIKNSNREAAMTGIDPEKLKGKLQELLK